MVRDARGNVAVESRGADENDLSDLNIREKVWSGRTYRALCLGNSPHSGDVKFSPRSSLSSMFVFPFALGMRAVTLKRRPCPTVMDTPGLTLLLETPFLKRTVRASAPPFRPSGTNTCICVARAFCALSAFSDVLLSVSMRNSNWEG